MLIVVVFGLNGTACLLYLLGCYFTIFAIAALKKVLLKKEKSETRNIKQIFINGGLAMLCLLVNLFYPSKVLLITGLINIAGNFVDSVSSDVGTMAKGKPYDFIHRKQVETGLSGGVSLLGTTAALMASIGTAASISRICHMTAAGSLVCFVIIFLQTIIDTILGSLFQVKYFCKVHNHITEKKECGGMNTVYKSGIKWIDNNMVNLISTCIITAISLICFGAAYVRLF